MLEYIYLGLLALVPIVLAISFFLINKYTKFNNLSFKIKQIIYGIAFGAAAVVATELGPSSSMGAVLNVRDASVLISGLLFGGPSGLIAGFIGGIERFLSVYFNNGQGAYTQLACSISTIIAGVSSFLLNIFLFEKKKPALGYALCIGAVVEVFHMLMVFITNLNDVEHAFEVVRTASIPMISINTIALGLAVLAIILLSKEKIIDLGNRKSISNIFQRKILLSVLIAFVFTSFFTVFLQYRICDNNIHNVLYVNSTDVANDILVPSDKSLLNIAKSECESFENLSDFEKIMNQQVGSTEEENKQLTKEILADEITTLSANGMDICEINIINHEGKIVASSHENNYNFQMDLDPTSQSAEFVTYFKENPLSMEFVQAFQMNQNEQLWRKYGARRLKDNKGFIQVAYNEEQFRTLIDKEAKDASINRTIGKNGYIIIADKDGIIVSNKKEVISTELDDLGIELDTLKKGEVRLMDMYEEDAYFYYSEVEGYKLLSFYPKAEATLERDLAIYIAVFMQVIVFVILFIILYYLIKTLVVNNVIKMNKSLTRIANGYLDTIVDVRTNQEFTSLSQDINYTVDVLKSYIKAAEDRIAEELEMARHIQKTSLPMIFPPYPNRFDFDIFASMDAAKQVGGDFYDFFLTDKDHLAVLIADVSGKGIPAALFMMRAKTLIKSYMESGKSVDETFILTNNKLCLNNDANMFVTAWLGLLDLTNGTLEFVNAGHDLPFLKSNNKYSVLKSKPGFVLAGIPSFNYKKEKITLNKGDAIFLYTDGINEAFDANKKMYGDNRLINLLNDNANLSPYNLCQKVKKDVFDFMGICEQSDDITMLSLVYKGEHFIKDIKVTSSFNNIEKVNNFVTRELKNFGIDKKTLSPLFISIDEIFSNISNYAYTGSFEDIVIRLEVEENPLSMSLTFIDNGSAFNPLTIEDPDTQSDVKERKIGGLGIFMVKKLMDEVKYEFIDNKNHLTIKKILK